MSSRGPDGSGLWLSEDGILGFGHRRLAIIDPTELGAQPMTLDYCQRTAERQLVITFNGEIYNHRELRLMLEQKGHSFRSACDTEVLLHLYEEYGGDLVHHLRGMFAFAIWDAQDELLFLARDPFGIKPLYIADDGDVLRFASQARALLTSGDVDKTPDEAGLAAFLVLGSVPEPRTAWRAIRQLPAGSTMVVDRVGLASQHVFFSVNEELRDAATREPSPLAPALAASVRAHLVADVDVGLLLSAGVDSGTILGLAADESGPLQAVTLGFEEFRRTAADETVLAAEVACMYGARHSVAIVSERDFERSVPQFIASMDQPSIDGLIAWFISRAARDAGLKVALTGLGGDELVGGYSTFSSVPALRRRLAPFMVIPGLGRAARTLLRAALTSSMNPKIASTLEYGGSLETGWLLRRSVFLPWELGPILGTDRAMAAFEELQLVDDVLRPTTAPDPGSDTTRVAAMETGLYMRNQLLRDADWASMAHSVEVRVPFVDAVLLRVAAPAFRSWTRDGAKTTLAMASGVPLPELVTARAKTGFGIPMQTWLAVSRTASEWREVPELTDGFCSWAKRWAYTVAHKLDLLGS